MNAPRAARAPFRVEKIALAILSVVALLLIIFSPKLNFNLVRAQFEQTPVRHETVLAPVSDDKDLFFASADTVGIAATTYSKSDGDSSVTANADVLTGEFLSAADVESFHKATTIITDGEETGHGGSPRVSGMFASPDGKMIAVEYDFVSRPQVRVLDLSTRAEPTLRDLVPAGWGYFLDWHPDGKSILMATVDLNVPDAGLWLVNVSDGSHVRIETPGSRVPEGILSADISPDGKTIVYSISNGLGLGSEVWMADISGENQKQLLVDEFSTMAELVWSPDGTQIAFVKLEDSPIAFAEAGLWLMDQNGTGSRALAWIDGGQGQSPVWNSNGQEIYYVARANPDNLEANYDAKLTTTSIRSIGVEGKEYRTVVPSDGARHLDISFGKDGTLLFVSNRGGVLEVWSVDQSGLATQLSSDGASKRYPLFISSAN